MQDQDTSVSCPTHGSTHPEFLCPQQWGENPARTALILKLRSEGRTLAQISGRVNLSRERIRLIVKKSELKAIMAQYQADFSAVTLVRRLMRQDGYSLEDLKSRSLKELGALRGVGFHRSRMLEKIFLHPRLEGLIAIAERYNIPSRF